jgi:hypothetical protein
MGAMRAPLDGSSRCTASLVRISAAIRLCRDPRGRRTLWIRRGKPQHHACSGSTGRDNPRAIGSLGNGLGHL